MTLDEIDKKIKNSPSLIGTTGNEGLVLSRLLEEFDFCKVNDKNKAKYILEKLGFGINDINGILS
ncbi:MAG: hypothetical protein ABGX00_11885 [Allomuricauda sp.]